ncbi:unnamed protein product [Protopolystoma xenopodis]|uniref:Uncharacterized protein n=1 Tax=Protopolystoma xenopodis TaxID=117903 RepID=A0A3S5FGH1_9PLAT|nr:unnamed protein product [Protopolystoma xenopodis]
MSKEGTKDQEEMPDLENGNYVFISPEEFREYLREIQEWIAITGRPRYVHSFGQFWLSVCRDERGYLNLQFE